MSHPHAVNIPPALSNKASVGLLPSLKTGPSSRFLSNAPVPIATISPRDMGLPVAQFPCFYYKVKCIRFGFLDGIDSATGHDYSHRRLWLSEHLALLLSVFCIDVVGFKIQPNQYHVILSCNEREAQTLSRHEVIVRWRQLYKGPKAIDNYVAGNVLSRADRETLAATAEQWRGYLTNTGRLLGHLHQSIAHRVNREEDCRGRFWEGRSTGQMISSQASLNALLTELDAEP